MRWIDKVGGIDNYLMNTPAKKLQSQIGVKLQKRMLKVAEQQKQSQMAANASENSKVTAKQIPIS